MTNEDFESQEELGLGGKAKNWIQDNIRIIISVLIVVVIAGGIYSYSNRSQDSISEDEIALEGEFMIDDQDLEEELAEVQEIDDEKEEVQIDEKSAESEVVEEAKTISQETEEAFVETAVAGDGQTTLARKALASYLEKNNDSDLTAEHKIYIEDYLRKNVNHVGGVSVGDQMSFSKNLIKNSIEKSKTLNAAQLENLEKYSARVPSLR